MKVYLAGKIAKNDWRGSVVREVASGSADPIPDVFQEQPMSFDGFRSRSQHVCTGPFFIRCDHGCYHGRTAHGMGANDRGCYDDRVRNDQVVALCLDAIRRSDVVFTWFGDDADGSYGTLFELGYARALGVPVWVAGTQPLADQWFVHTAVDRTLWNATDPRSALRWYLENSAVLPQSLDAYLKDASADPEVIAARKLFTEFGPAGVRVAIPRHIRSAVWDKTGGTCWYCKKPINPYDDFQVDHVIPVAKGGANRIDNLVPCCQACNASKRDRQLTPGNAWK